MNQRSAGLPEWIMAFATLGVLLATFANVCVAVRQWRAMRDSVEISRKAFDVNDRAWVFGSIVGKPFIRSPEGLFAVQIALQNAGKSPAIYVLHGAECTSRLEPPNAAISEPREAFIPNTATPKEAVAERHTCWGMPKDAVAKLTTERQSIYVWLLIQYRDPFTVEGTSRLTQQCWSQQLPIEEHALTPCPPQMQKFL